MSSVTVRFDPSNTSQHDLLRQLQRVAHSLEADGVLRNVKVEAVFPGDETEQFKGAFVVSFHGSPSGQVITRLNEVPGVRKAYVAPARGEGELNAR